MDLFDAALVAAALERRVEEHGEDLVGEARSHDPPAHREHVRVIVLTSHPCGVEVVAQRGPDADDLVRGDLFALPAPPEDDASIGLSPCDPPADLGADRRIVDAFLAVRSEVVDVVAALLQARDEVDFESVPSVIGPDRHPHARGSYGRDARMLRPVRRRFTSWGLLGLMVTAVVVGFGPARSHAATVEVSIDDFEFSPATVSAAPGDTIRFTNNGSAVHHVVAADGSFDSGALGAGETFSVIIGDRPVPFSCARHENMTGTIALQIVGTSTTAPPVTAAATTAPPDAPTATTAAELAFTGSERGPLMFGALIAIALGATGLALVARRATPIGATVGVDLLPGSDRDRRRNRVRKPPAEF